MGTDIKSKEKYINTPYDDVFRTLVVDQCKLVIPIINEAFGENYTGDEKIVFSMNEHFINAQDGDEDKRVTDSSFSIVGKTTKKYLLECQSNPDSSMLVRIFEYATQIALDEGEISGDVLTVEIPNSAVLFLRATAKTPDEMKIRIITPGGSVEYPVKVMQAQRYTLDEIFQKKLLFLMPFYIFTYDKKLETINRDVSRLESLKTEYNEIMDYLEELYNKGEITALTHKTLIEMTEKVVDNLAVKFENVRKGVKDVMGGRVLEYEAKTIYNNGKDEEKRDMVLSMHENGLSDDLIAKIAKISVDKVKEILGGFVTA